MKKFLFILCASFIFATFSTDLAVNAQVPAKAISKQREKKYKNLYKDKVKQLNKEGWKVDGDSRTLDVALLDHYNVLSEEGTREIIGEVSRCRSKNVGRQRAIWSAQNQLVSLLSADIVGRMGSIIEADDTSESEAFCSAFEKNMKANVSDLLNASFSICLKDGANYQYQTFFILDEVKAAAARRLALEQTAQNVQLSKDVMNKISQFINEGLPQEQD